jgi:SAM-dependent methyltransferase
MASPEYEYYSLMATSWDLLRGDTSAWEDRSFFLEVIHSYGGPVLDVGCGTGRTLLDFMQQGIDIDGVDVSPEMLALCKQKADKSGLKPNLQLQKMEELDLPRKYRCIMVPSSSFQLLIDPALPPLAMRRFHEHLVSGGVLVMPFMTLWKEGDPLEAEWTKEAVRPEDGALVRRTSWSRFKPATGMEDTRDTYQILRDGQVIATELHDQAPATLSYTQGQARTLFEQAGFKHIQTLSNFTFEPVKSPDMLFCVLGVKP